MRSFLISVSQIEWVKGATGAYRASSALIPYHARLSRRPTLFKSLAARLQRMPTRIEQTTSYTLIIPLGSWDFGKRLSGAFRFSFWASGRSRLSLRTPRLRRARRWQENIA